MLNIINLNIICIMHSCKFPSLGSYIQDAVEGSYTPYRVGSQDEHRFWKIICRRLTHKDVVKCFYLNPESYEQDVQTKIGETEKLQWYLDRDAYVDIRSTSVSSK